MRALLLAGVLAAAGCHGDVCGDGQSCVELVVDSDGTVGAVDQLELQVFGAASFGPGRTERLSDPESLPLTTDIAIPTGRSGDVTVGVNALRDGNVVGEGASDVPIIPGGRVRLTIHVTAQPPRRVFLMPAHNGVLGTRAAVDMACGNAAAAAEIKGSFSAVIGYTNIAGPSDFIKLPGGDRKIVRVDGALVASDSSFFQSDHVNAIDLGAAGEPPSSDCVWTNFTAEGKARGADCAGWTDGSMMRGNYGLVAKADVNWADFGDNKTCDALCHVYCMEQ